MNKTFLRRAIAAIGLASIASFASAGPVNNSASWTTSGADRVNVSNREDGGVTLSYFKGDYFCAGCGQNYWEFKTQIDNAGTVSFDIDYVAFNGWFMAGSSLTLLVNDTAVASYATDNYKGQFSYDFQAGDVLKFLAYETNGDSQPNVWGNILLSNIQEPAGSNVPEPASIALLGLGMLGLGALRRKR
jgi:hypothetical protein